MTEEKPKRGPYNWKFETRTEPRKMPFVTCGDNGGINQNGVPCHQPAGMRTDHLWLGNCWRHYGGNQTREGLEALEARKKINSILSEVKTEELAALAERVGSDDRNVFDFREHIYLLEALALYALEKGQLGEAAKLLRSVMTGIEKLHNIEVGRRVVVDTRDVDTMITEFAQIVHRHITDKDTKIAIARDIGRMSMPKPWDAEKKQLPAHSDGDVIEAEYVEK